MEVNGKSSRCINTCSLEIWWGRRREGAANCAKTTLLSLLVLPWSLTFSLILSFADLIDASFI
jgi:hypothetical protein